MRLRGFDVTKGQLGWVCDCHFMVTTIRQFTAEEHAVRDGSSWLLLAMLKAWWLARRTARAMQAKPGERTAIGWAE